MLTLLRRIENEIFGLALILMLIFFLQSCSFSPCPNKKAFLEYSDSFFEEYHEERKELSVNEKKAYNKKFDALVEECYKPHKTDMTLKEKQGFWKDAFFFITSNNAEYKDNGFSIEKDSYDLSPYVEAEFEEVLKESGENFSETLQSLVDEELPKVIDKVVDEVGKLGEEIKKILEDVEIKIETEQEEKQD